MPPSKSILQKGPSLDRQPQSMIPTKSSEPIPPDLPDLSNPMGRRSSTKPLPQNVLTLEDLMPSSPTPSQYPQSGTPTSLTSQSNTYMSPGGHPLSPSQYGNVSSYQQQPNQYGQQTPYGQYASSHYGSSQNVDQYGNYGQGYQNQYQQPGYANQQVIFNPFTRFKIIRALLRVTVITYAASFKKYSKCLLTTFHAVRRSLYLMITFIFLDVTTAIFGFHLQPNVVKSNEPLRSPTFWCKTRVFILSFNFSSFYPPFSKFRWSPV